MATRGMLHTKRACRLSGVRVPPLSGSMRVTGVTGRPTTTGDQDDGSSGTVPMLAITGGAQT